MKHNVELIYDLDCPNVAVARAALLQAFARAGVSASWREWNRKAPDTPPHLRGYGSPTLLVNGKDVAGDELTEGGDCCRLYSVGNTGLQGVPAIEQIVVALTKESIATASADSRLGAPGGWPGILAIVPVVGTSLLPLGTCPACWPAYAGLLSTIGSGVCWRRLLSYP